MPIDVQPQTTRAWVPIRVTARTDESPVTVVVRPKDEPTGSGFALKMAPAPEKGTFHGTFSMERPGTYEVTLHTPRGIESATVTVQPQVFMNFPREFGIFSVLLGAILIGVAVWIRRIQRRHPGRP